MLVTWISCVGMYSSTNFLPCSRCHSAVLPVFLSPRITIFTGREHRSGKQSEQGKLAPPQASTHTFCTRMSVCRRAGSLGEEAAGTGWRAGSPAHPQVPRAADRHLGVCTQEGSLRSRQGCALTSAALRVPRLPLACLPAARASWVQDMRGVMAGSLVSTLLPSHYLGEACSRTCPGGQGGLGTRWGGGKVPRCCRRVGFLPPAEKAGAQTKSVPESWGTRQNQRVGVELMALGGQLGLCGGKLGSLQGGVLEATGRAGAASPRLVPSARQGWAWEHRRHVSCPVIL